MRSRRTTARSSASVGRVTGRPLGKAGGARPKLPRIIAANLEALAYDAIKRAIVNLEFRPGDPLVETDIAAQLAVSKTPVREALIRLEREGLVESGPNRGRAVVRLSARDVQEVFEIRGLLVSHLASRLATTAREALFDELEATIRAAEQASRAGDQRAYFMHVRNFDRILYDASPNLRMTPLLQNFQDLLDIIGAISNEVAGRSDRSNLEHRRILEALRARGPDHAAQRMAEHIRSVLADYLTVVDKHASDGPPSEG